MSHKYDIIDITDHYDVDIVIDEWQISKAIISDNVKLLFSSLPCKSKDHFVDRIKSLKTFEPNLDLLSTAAKHCKKEICKALIDNFRFDPNCLSNDGSPLHWLIKSNIFTIIDLNMSAKSQQQFHDFEQTFYCLVNNEANPSSRDSKGYTPLHYAAMLDNYGGAYLLLTHNPKLKDEKENHGMTPLHLACKHGSENVSLLLIDRLTKEDLSIIDKNSMLTLHHACKCKIEKTLIVEKILEKSRLILTAENFNKLLNQKDKFENSILNLAIKENHLEIAEILLKANSSFKYIYDHEKNFPIHVAAKYGSLDMFRLLEKYNYISFEPNYDWNNVFHLAGYENKYKILIELLDNYESNKDKIDFALNSFNRENMTPLLCAISRGSIDFIDILLKHEHLSETLLNIEMFRICIENNQKNALKYLLELNRNLYMDNPRIIKDSYNNSILHYTCINKNFVLFKVLVDYILDGNMLMELIDSKNQNDESIFSIACKNGCLEIVEYLLKLRKLKKVFNYDPLNCRDDEYSTPLHSAAKTNHLRILELLIENGANVNLQDQFNKIPLHYSCEIGSFEICKILVENRSKINTCDIHNKTPLDYATFIGHNELVSFLLKNGALVHDIDENHYNAFDIAIDQGHKGIVEMFIRDENFSSFFYFQNEKSSKIKKLIKKLPNSMRIVLDRCYDNEKEKYNFTLIDNPDYIATYNHPLWLIAHYQYKYLLAHKTVVKLLHLKMSRGPKVLFWISLVYYFWFLIFLTIYHINITSAEEIRNANWLKMSQHYSNSSIFISHFGFERTITLWPTPLAFTLSDHVFTYLFWIFRIYFLILVMGYLTRKVVQVHNYGFKIFTSIEHWLEILCFFFNTLSLMPFKHGCSAFAALSVLFGWISLGFCFQSVNTFKIGSYSVALLKTLQNSFKFIPFFFMIYFGFLCSFKIRENFGITFYNNTVTHIIRTITMMVGELNTHEMGIETDGFGIDFFTNNAIYICFIFIMCIIVLDLFIGLEVGEIKTVIDEAETQNVAMNLKFTLECQDVFYTIYKVFNPKKTPTFMNFIEHNDPKVDSLLHLGKRPDLLNRVENYLVILSHEIDSHMHEQIKQMIEVKEQIEIIMHRLDFLRKRIVNNNNEIAIFGNPKSPVHHQTKSNYELNLNQEIRSCTDINRAGTYNSPKKHASHSQKKQTIV